MVKTKRKSKRFNKNTLKLTGKNFNTLKLTGGKLKANKIERKFQIACENGDLIKALNILDKNPTINIAVDDNYAFLSACEEGHLKVAQWLYELNHKQVYPPNNKFDNTFVLACTGGHLEMAKWLFEISKNDNYPLESYLSLCNETDLIETCRWGHIDIVEWLLEVRTNINISANDEDPFRTACYGGYLDIAKLLLSKKPDINISILNDWAYRNCCKNNKVEVLKWLCTLNPFRYEHYFDIDNNKNIWYILKNCDENMLLLLYALTNNGYANEFYPELLMDMRNINVLLIGE